MKNILAACLLLALSGVLLFCKNNTATSKEGETQNAATDFPPARTDSLVGFKGCDRAGFQAVGKGIVKFTYQHFAVQVAQRLDKMGEKITVIPLEGGESFDIPDLEAPHFIGVCRDYLFMDSGTGPDGRELFIFNVKNKTMVFQTKYCGDETWIVHDEKIWYSFPVDESEIAEKPECPEKEAWEKQGLRVGYGQRRIFDFLHRQLTQKSEYKCIAMQ